MAQQHHQGELWLKRLSHPPPNFLARSLSHSTYVNQSGDSVTAVKMPLPNNLWAPPSKLNAAPNLSCMELGLPLSGWTSRHSLCRRITQPHTFSVWRQDLANISHSTSKCSNTGIRRAELRPLIIGKDTLTGKWASPSEQKKLNTGRSQGRELLCHM